jgi:hypothetical protein
VWLNNHSYSVAAILLSLPLQQLDKTLSRWRVEIAARYHHRLVAIHMFPNGTRYAGLRAISHALTE